MSSMTRVRRARRSETAPELLAWLRDESPPPLRAKYFMSDDELRALWDEHKDAIIAKWVRVAPGSRPSMWWVNEAPEPCRLRLAGKGTVEAFTTHQLGLPTSWRSEGFDEDDPPRFESQHAYLKRLKLLLAGESARPHPLDEELPLALWPQECAGE